MKILFDKCLCSLASFEFWLPVWVSLHPCYCFKESRIISYSLSIIMLILSQKAPPVAPPLFNFFYLFFHPKLSVWLPVFFFQSPRGLLLSEGTGPVQTRPQPAQCQRVTQALRIPPISHWLRRPSVSLPPHFSLAWTHTQTHTDNSPCAKR